MVVLSPPAGGTVVRTVDAAAAVLTVDGVLELVHPASISVMATVATTAILRTVHSYSTSAGRRDVGVITRSRRKEPVTFRPHGGRRRPDHFRRCDRIGTTRGSPMPVNRVPSVFAGAVTGHAPPALLSLHP